MALVAADHPETARRAAKRIVVDYEVLPAATDPRARPRRRRPAPGATRAATSSARCRSAAATRRPTAPVVVALDFEVGMQDQAFLGPESGLAVPAEDGGVDLFVATQWLHVDQGQICRVLGLPPEKVRLSLAGVGGAFGGREDLSMHVHACLLALRTGKPVKMSYARDESFYGHVHRHPAWLRYEFGARARRHAASTAAPTSCSTAARTRRRRARSSATAARSGLGPYRFPNVRVDARGVYTNNPPCGAMRGFGCVQAAFAHEALMDELADRVGVDRVEIRALNGMREGDHNITGQLIDSAAPGGRADPDRAGPAAAARASAPRSTSASSPAASPTPPTARASCAASATPSRTRTSASPRASTTTPPPACGWR